MFLRSYRSETVVPSSRSNDLAVSLRPCLRTCWAAARKHGPYRILFAKCRYKSPRQALAQVCTSQRKLGALALLVYEPSPELQKSWTSLSVSGRGHQAQRLPDFALIVVRVDH